MKQGFLRLEKNETHMLLGLVATLYGQARESTDKGAIWVRAGHKLKYSLSRYSPLEIDLFKMAVTTTLTAANNMLGRLPEDDAASRLRAGVVIKTYESIKGKLDNVQFAEETDQLHQRPEDLRGDDQEGGPADGADVREPGPGASADQRTDGSSEQP